MSRSHVEVDGKTVGRIQQGLLVLLGVAEGDTLGDAQYLANKVAGLRVFEDSGGKMNLSVQEIAGSILVISQFTLLGDARKGHRPSFINAAPREIASDLYDHFCRLLTDRGIPVAKGIFQADMQVHLVNNGPVTILLDSKKEF